MIGKLIILGAVVAALVVLVPYAYKMMGTPTLEVVKQRIEYVTYDRGNNGTATPPVSNIANQTANGTTPISIDELNPKYVNKKIYTGQVFQKTGTTCDISVPDMAETVNGQKELTHIIEIGNCSSGAGQPVQVTSFALRPGAPQSVSTPNAIQIVPYAQPNPTDSTSTNTENSGNSASASTYPTLPPYYQVIILNAQNQGNNVWISYEDSSGKTTLVTVTLKNTDKQIVGGTFASSQFQAEIRDVPNTPHIIDMVVENSVYGTLHGSVYVPSNIQNSTIAGIFTGP